MLGGVREVSAVEGEQSHAHLPFGLQAGIVDALVRMCHRTLQVDRNYDLPRSHSGLAARRETTGYTLAIAGVPGVSRDRTGLWSGCRVAGGMGSAGREAGPSRGSRPALRL
ncbi:hypothetical protein Ssi02_62320 [Sinosporangium siamense]|uniref:Uncharacterized protein n=1 Tax=Sinosporangium siamense TaxID=1367973 RepID=A0A919VA32_9ACTN|nr:hypothetical protein Ssi02_62320 [Sinosporangium siamense]